MAFDEDKHVINPQRDETESERIDRNLEELIHELRVAIPGVQVLFAFLLTMPFNSRFGMLTAAQEKLYFGILICTALAATLLIAPSMHHRLQFRMNRKHRVLIWSHRLAIAGLTLLAFGMTGAVFLIGDFVFDSTTAAFGAAIPALTILIFWYVVPLLPARDD